MRVLSLTTPLSDIEGVGPKFLVRLKRLGVTTIRDLLWHFPTRYEDFSQIYKIADLEPGQQATIQGVIEEVEMRRSFRRRMTIVEAVIRDESGSIRAVWFNQPYVRNVLRAGKIVNIAAKVSINDGELYLSHPTYELAPHYNEETRHTGRLVPIYPETKGLTSKGIRFLVQPILKNVGIIPEWIPENILKANDFPNLETAVHNVHFPETLEDAERAKRRFAFEDLFLLQLWNLEQKAQLRKEKAPMIRAEIEHAKEIFRKLPFELTVSQKKSLWEIMQDIGKPVPMNRLLQGDVGSGKTVVAALAALFAAEQGYQTAFMAPTEVLARQHFKTLTKLFEKITDRAPLGLITSKSAEAFYEKELDTTLSKKNFLKKTERGELAVVVGTHALIETSMQFKNLGFVVVDEQHRFGVTQRAVLASKKQHTEHVVPHFLSMSATPIPRTLMLTIFGDLDISTIDELPTGRKQIVTKVVAPEDRAKAYGFIRGEVKKGRQAFVICPRIEKSEEEGHKSYEFQKKLEVKSVKEEYEKLSRSVFPDLRVTMLHGQMKSKEKERAMRLFQEDKADILVATSVVEVGVDVPNATVMMIEGSDRFGLAQLYQFRGRVGRGEHQSYCFLFTDSNARSTDQRLQAIIKAKNGFALAEEDLKIRGPGQFLGTEQTGLPDLAMRGLQDIALIKTSREAAATVLLDKKTLSSSTLRMKLAEFRKRIHPE